MKMIKTRHPQKGKQNKPIAEDKYEIVKDAILATLKNSEPTYTELVDALRKKLKTSFDGNIDWCTMVVKLDLEARKIIERTKSSSVRYHLHK
jgi:hypothetical protein